MSFKDTIANFFGLGSKQTSNEVYIPDKVDQAAHVIATPGPDGKKRRYDGSDFNSPYQHAAGYDSGRKDFLSKFFGSEVRKQSDGSWRGIAGAEMIRGPDGLFRRKDDMRPQRKSGGLETNNQSLDYDSSGPHDDDWLKQ